MELENQRIPNILVTGTPGTGKTTLCRLLGEYTSELRHYDVGSLINTHKLYTQWNEKYNLPEFDDDMVVDFLEPEIQKGGCIIDFHTSEIFPERWFELVFLVRANNTVLFDRLQARNYTQEKIEENIECEIMEVTSEEVYSSYKHEIITEIRNEQQEDVQKNIELIISKLKSTR